MTDSDNTSQIQSIEEGWIFDYITGNPVKDTPKEKVRQRIARALLHEDGINVEDMEPDFKMKVDGRNKKIDIAIFEPGTEHLLENLRRIVICEKEPKVSTKGAYKMRDHNQAKKDFELLHSALAEDDVPDECKYGLWTNGLDFFFFQKIVSRFDVTFSPMGHWPDAEGTIGTRQVHSDAKLRKADPDMLRVAFRRCHNFIHGNEGMPKDAAFWQFLRLIYCKMYDEGQSDRRFYAGYIPREIKGTTQYIDEQFDEEGRKDIRQRIVSLFDDVKRAYPNLFDGTEQITLSDRALAFMVAELGKYDMRRADVDAKGAAYQEIVGTNLRGDRGQYFTPRSAIKLVVEMLDPKEDERVLDPSCGTGGFLVEAVNHQLRRFRSEKENKAPEDTEEFLCELERIRAYVEEKVFGADFDPFLVKATTMNMTMAANSPGHLFHMDSLSFPEGHLSGVAEAKQQIPFGSIDVLMTNPPFGSDIPITDPEVLGQFDLASKWDKNKKTGEILRGDGYQKAVAPEVLFIERAIKWMKPGGRAGIVLPDGILGNPGDEPIRKWILRHCWVLASVDLPVETFIAEANVNILTSLLFLKKKTAEEIQAEDLGQVTDYPVFMAVAEKVGLDRRGNTLYKRGPDGEELLQDVTETETIRVNGQNVQRTLHRKEKILDNDLIEIGKEYRKFRQENPEPGL